MNTQFEKRMNESNGNCEGCWEQECSPTWNRYADLMLCDSCYEKAEDEQQNKGYGDGYDGEFGW